MHKKVSIITPVKDLIVKGDADYFLRLVESVQNQTYDNIEHIVVDGNSSDGTRLVLMTCGDSISFVSEPDTGAADALNKGIQKATGEYVLFLNAVDFLADETSIEKAVEALEKSGTDFIYGPSWSVRPTGQKSKLKTCLAAVFKGEPFCLQSVLFKKQMIEDEGLFNPDYHFLYGYDLILRMVLNGASCAQNAHITSSILVKELRDKPPEQYQVENYVILKNAYAGYEHLTDEELIRMVFIHQVEMPFMEEVKTHLHPEISGAITQMFQKIVGRCDVFDGYKKQGYDTLYLPLIGVGDALLFAPIARRIFEKTGKKVLVAHKNPEIFENNPYVEVTDALFDRPDVCGEQEILKLQQMGFKIIYPNYWVSHKFSTGLWGLTYPKQHIIAQSFAVCGFSGKVELKPEIYLTDEEKSFGRFASSARKQVAIMSAAISPRKQWPYFQDLINALKEDCDFVQIGAPEDAQLEGVAFQKVGQLTLRQSAGVLYNSDLFVGEIGALMHMARAVDCPAVIAYSGTEPEYLASYACNTNVLPDTPCMLSQLGQIDKNCEPCVNGYRCCQSISLKKMVAAVRAKLGSIEKRPFPIETATVEALPMVDILARRRAYNMERAQV